MDEEILDGDSQDNGITRRIGRDTKDHLIQLSCKSRDTFN